jgi:CHAT domain-containing protein/Tfp pilus assembly protein PilF
LEAVAEVAPADAKLRQPAVNPRLWLGVLLVAASLLTAAAAEDAAESLLPELQSAEALYRRDGPEAALPVFEELARTLGETGDIRSEAVAVGFLGEIYWRLGNYEEASHYLEQALDMKREAGDRLQESKTLNVLGLLHWDLGEFEQAQTYLREGGKIAEDLGDKSLQGAILNNLSLVHDELGDYYVSLKQYQQVLDLYRGADFPRGEGDTLGNIGGVYLLLGRFQEALDHYQRALAISEQLQSTISMSQDHGNVALCYLGLGQVDLSLAHFDQAIALATAAGMQQDQAYWLRARGNAWLLKGRYDLALEHHRAALALYQQLDGKTESVEALHDMGNLYLLLGDSVSAERHYRQAMQIARDIGLSRGITRNLLALGDLERRRAEPDRASDLYRESIQRAASAGERVSQGQALLRLAAVHAEQGRSAEALAGIGEAWKIAEESGAAGLATEATVARARLYRAQGDHAAALRDFDLALTKLVEAPDPELAWQAHYGRGLALAASGRTKAAINSLQAAVRVIEGIRDRLREERFKAGYVQDKYQVYIDLVRLQLESGLDEEAFSTAERLRSRSYLDLVESGMAANGNEDQLREFRLQARIRTLRQTLAEERDRGSSEQRQSAISVFSHELLAAERDYQAFLDDRHQAGTSVPAAEVPHYHEIAAALVEDEAVVEYVVGPESLMLFLLTRDRLLTHTVEVRREDLDNKVALLSSLIRQRSSDRWEKPASSLARFLVEPLRAAEQLADIHHLYLVPHGSLNYLPFSLLPSHATEGSHRLIEDFTLAYLPTAAALSRNRRDLGEASSMLAIAPDVSRLRFARQEARAINALFEPDSFALLGRAATESAFKQLAPDYRMLHLATHGFFNKLSPLLSGVQLEADATNDGRLELHEILELKLNAELVTLSACETGLGSGYFAEVPAGDDYVGLTRAFLYAGSTMVLATLWEVDDASTLRLMRQFYGDLAEAAGGEDKTGALTRAQRALLSSREYNHPYFWAPFVLVGEMGRDKRKQI